MTLARKYTRPIKVNDTGYRWMLKETDYGDCYDLLLIVEAKDFPNGEQLVAHLKANDRRENDAVTPVVVATLIKEAHERGWNPQVRGSCPPCDDALLRLIRSNSAIPDAVKIVLS